MQTMEKQLSKKQEGYIMKYNIAMIFSNILKKKQIIKYTMQFQVEKKVRNMLKKKASLN